MGQCRSSAARGGASEAHAEDAIAEDAILRREPPAWFDGGKVQLSPHATSECDEGTAYSSIYYTLQYDGKEKWKSTFASSTSNIGGARGDHLDAQLRHKNRVLVVTTGTLSGRATTNLETTVLDVAKLAEETQTSEVTE